MLLFGHVSERTRTAPHTQTGVQGFKKQGNPLWGGSKVANQCVWLCRGADEEVLVSQHELAVVVGKREIANESA